MRSRGRRRSDRCLAAGASGAGLARRRERRRADARRRRPARRRLPSGLATAAGRRWSIARPTTRPATADGRDRRRRGERAATRWCCRTCAAATRPTGEFQAYQQEGTRRLRHHRMGGRAAVVERPRRHLRAVVSRRGAVAGGLESPPHLVAMVPAMTFASPTHFWYTGGVWDSSWLLWTWLNMAPDLRRRAGADRARAATRRRGPPGRARAARRLLSRPLSALPAFQGRAPTGTTNGCATHPTTRGGSGRSWPASTTASRPPCSTSAAGTTRCTGRSAPPPTSPAWLPPRGGTARGARTQVVIGPWTHGTDLATTEDWRPRDGPGGVTRLRHAGAATGWIAGCGRRQRRRPPAAGARLRRWAPTPGAAARCGRRRPSRGRCIWAARATAAGRPGTLTWTAPAVATTSRFVVRCGAPGPRSARRRVRRTRLPGAVGRRRRRHLRQRAAGRRSRGAGADRRVDASCRSTLPTPTCG